MQILVNVSGKFLEPFGKAGVGDAVSFLQLEAMSGEEAQILQQLHRVLCHGGSFSVNRPQPGRMDVSCEFHDTVPEPESSPRVQGLVAEAALVVPSPAPPSPEHRHVFSSDVGARFDGEGVWLGCLCGEWHYFPHPTQEDQEQEEDEARPKFLQ